ncbi:MAG: pyrroline-5-carboxylate reductase [Geminicoccaceae bacterium]
MTKLAGPLLLVGCGKMGSALLCGWIEHGLSGDDIVVVEPARSAMETISGRFDVHVVGHIADVEPNRRFRAVVFAVKPQVMDSVLPAYAERIDAETVVISIAAGCSVRRFEQAFGDGIAVVRAMPNTPAAIGQGVTALFANARADQDQHKLAEALMTAVGTVHWVDDEALMHAITAMSGGGPAYVFLLIEALAQAGMASGLPEDLAWPMARATVIGSSALAEASDEPAATLRRNVTSPGGTTQAALEVLMAPDGVQPLFDQAMAAATRRSQELS